MLAQQETAILAQAWQQKQALEAQDKKYQAELDAIKKALTKEKLRDSTVSLPFIFT